MKRILAINPGSTSTKVGVYDDDQAMMMKTIRHSVDELSRFTQVMEQFEFRRELVLRTLANESVPFAFDAIVGRGGLLRPVAGGVYAVNDRMLHDAFHAPRMHACNLGCLIAADLAARLSGCSAYVADPGVVDELEEVARITGSPLMPRITIWHALNQRGIARRYATECGLRYEDLNLIVCHLGGGISVGAHRHGRAIDVPNALDGEGPFSPERAGTLPAGALIDLCFSGRFTRDELKKRISGHAGLAAHLGTTDMPEILRRIEQGGDRHAALVVDAMIYQTAKAIGGAAVALYGQVDAILLTGGMAHSDYVTSRLSRRVSFLGSVSIYPGEDEMLALAQNALKALRGELEVKEYM